ncbi:MAG: transporter [Thermodesulfovibrionales bacterium]
MKEFLPIRTIFSLLLTLILSQTAFAAHPLITDDTGTQGKENFQLELNGEFSWDKEHETGLTVKERVGEFAAALSYGISDSADLVLGIPYQWFETKENGVLTGDETGLSDLSLELKWRFLEQDGLSLALKPGLTIPTGDADRGFGTGKATCSLFFIATKEAGPWAFHFNLGYGRNENKVGEKEDIWHASLAGEIEAAKDLKLVGNLGVETNPDEGSDSVPAFAIAGLIYSLSENLDLDLGLKCGITKPETDITLLYGLARRF